HGCARIRLERRAMILCRRRRRTISTSTRPSRAPRALHWSCAIERYLGSVTKVTVFTRLFASTKLLSGVTEVLRTMLPPPGIVQLWNFSVLGSKRTTVFGLASDSLYQRTSWIAEMP